MFQPVQTASVEPVQTSTVKTTNPTVDPPALTLTFLSDVVNGCSQVANVNATWTGPSYYVVGPGSFYLIVKQKNAIYGNTTDVVNPNNIVSQWYLFQNIPITLKLSFFSCTSIAFETLVYSDGQFTIVIA